MRVTAWQLLAVVLVLPAFARADVLHPDGEATRARLEAHVAQLAGGASADASRNAIVRVSVPRLGFEHTAAAGRARADAKAAMSRDQPFYIASITKPMVAVRILQLVEAGRISLDSSLGQLGLLPEDALQQLQVHDGRSYGADITVRQLLQHRTGLRDMLLDDREHLSEAVDGGTAAGSLGGIWSSQLGRFLECRDQPSQCAEGEVTRLYPAHRWTAFDAEAWRRNPQDRDAGLINFFLAEMGGAGLFPPGGAFHYADTNYILLGMLIEKLSGRSLHAELRDAVFRPLGMHDTYLSYAPDEDARPRHLPPADFWVGEVPAISSGLDISFDWAGGGVVTTAADLDRFLRGVATGRVFARPETRDTMLACVEVPARNGRAGGYGLGIRCLETRYGAMWGHTGAWGAVMVLFPEHDVSITGTVDRLFDNAAMESLAFGAMDALAAEGWLRRRDP